MHKLISLIILLTIFLSGCKTSTEPVPPEKKPPGYQEDIPWPSLADSPWPMFRGNPQYTGRSKFPGPKTGNIEWDYDTVYIETGAIIGPDKSIFFQTSGPMGLKGGLYKLNQSGDLQWVYEIKEIAAGTTPLILADSTIIVSTYIGGKIIALTYDGEEKWIFDTGTYVTSRGMNVGLDGTIYFIDSTKTLFALSNKGNLKWNLKIENVSFGWGGNPSTAFSPDGKILYITGAKKAIYAIDVNQRAIIWSYGNSSNIASPLVDSKGNIYLYGMPDSEFLYLTKLNPSGVVVWKYSVKYDGHSYFLEPTMDYNGNIYFGMGTDSLFSVNYEGKLNWKIELLETFGAKISSPLTCDAQNNIYVPIRKFSPLFQFKVLAFKSDGVLLWQTDWLLGESGDSPALGNGSLYFPTYRFFDIYSIK